MKKLLLTTACTGGLLASALALPTVFAQTKEGATKEGAAPRAAAPQKIAIIDMERVVRESVQFQQLREELRQLKVAKEQKLLQLQQQKNALVVDVREQQLGFDSDELVSKEEELIRIDSSAKTFAAVAKQQLMRRELEITAEMYTNVQKALDKFADANGYSFVMHAHRLDEESENDAELARTMMQTVTWHRNREEITDAVIQYLNESYETSEKVQPVAGASGSKTKASTAEGTKTSPKGSSTRPAQGAGANQPPRRSAEGAPRKTSK